MPHWRKRNSAFIAVRDRHEFLSSRISLRGKVPSVSDRLATGCHRIYGAKVWFNVEKRRLGKVHLEIGEHTADVVQQDCLAQRITDAMVTRIRVDLEADYFTAALMGARPLPEPICWRRQDHTCVRSVHSRCITKDCLATNLGPTICNFVQIQTTLRQRPWKRARPSLRFRRCQKMRQRGAAMPQEVPDLVGLK